jgi:hypothetical protein
MLNLWFPQLATTTEISPSEVSTSTTTAYPYYSDEIKFNESPNEMSSIENANEEENLIKK